MKVGDKVEVSLDDRWLPGTITEQWDGGRLFTVKCEKGALAYGNPARIPGAEKFIRRRGAVSPTTDPVSMPPHYTQLPVECIDVTEHFGFCLGNAIKYIWRADHKGKPVEDLEKAAWYIRREIERRKKDV